MTGTTEVERPAAAVAVAERYLRRERPLQALVTLLVVAPFLVTYAYTSLLLAVPVGLGLALVVRAPVLQSKGTFELRTDEDVAAVRDQFAGPTPPVLAFQWGIADTVTTDGDVATYEVSYLFGLQSVEVTVETQTTETSDGRYRVELAVATNDVARATYTATITPADGGATVSVEYESRRRFGLRRVPQQLLAERYREEVLAEQGYAVAERDPYFGP
jgi:hypothetical protein